MKETNDMATVLIVGASRGIGLEFVRQYAADGWTVHATNRAGKSGQQQVSGNVTWHPLEVREQASIDALAASLKGQPIDVAVLCAGVMGPRTMVPEAIDRTAWTDVLAINTMAPLAIAGAIRSNLLLGSQRKLAALSSRLGSIACNETGSTYIYRSSKAALNAVWRSLSIDTRGDGLICTVFHPGWVRTDMGGPQGEISPEESVAGLRKQIAGLTAAHSGRFFNYDGTELPW
jgi:NAD(P)-dependent dehydrogenase (short-subunit alcohol dehydrogenase family)